MFEVPAHAPNRTFPRARCVRVLFALLMLLAAGCSLNAAPDGGSVTISGAPVVRLVSPQPNATYLEGVAVNIQALITNAGEDINRVEIAIDNTIAGTLPQPNTSGSPSFSIAYTWAAAGVGTHVIGVTAFRADGSSSDPVSVTVNVVAQSAAQQQTQPTLESTAASTTEQTQQTQPTATATTPPTQAQPTSGESGQVVLPPSATPRAVASTPTQAQAASPTSNVPMASFSQPINVRRGPGTNFEPAIGVFQAGQTTQIIGINPARTWFKVRFGTGEGWVFGQLTTVSGDITNLPVDAGPPTPIPPTPTPVPPTAIPATAAPASNANLVAGIVVLEPSTPRCGETFTVGFDVANLGTQATSASGIVALRDVRASDGSIQQETIGGFPVIQPGQTFRVVMPLTVSTYYNEDHRITLTIDPQNQIPETENGDNVREVTYRLDKANCP